MSNQGNIDNFRLNLKRLASLNSLKLDDLKEIIEFCGTFFSQDLPQKFGKIFNLPFLIEGFSGKTFRLARGNKIESQEKIIAELTQDQTVEQKQKEKIIEELKKQQNKILQENLFLSDLVAFLEQSNVQLAKFLDQDHKQALAKLGSDFFDQIGLASKASSSQISLKELQKLENNPSIWQRVDGDLAQPMLAVISSQKERFEDKKETEDEKDEKTSAASAQEKKIKQQGSKTKADEEDGQDSESEVEEEKEKIKQTLPESFSKEFNLARLNDHSKLYIRSLAIISINQSLQIQFANLTKEQLAGMGFENTPNFDQLTIDSRQELLSIAFSKIESLLASGRYDLDKLISTPSLRISFSKDVALKIMTDIRGGEVFAREIGQLTQSNLSREAVKKQLEENQKQDLTQENLKQKLKIESSALPEDVRTQLDSLSSEEAETFFTQLDSQSELKDNFTKNIKGSFTRITKNNFLKEWQKIVAEDKNAKDRSFLAQENILPIIDTFIQQNYPVDYVEQFNWQRFQKHFGSDIVDQNTYSANEQIIKDLLTSYWKTQRAEWSHSIHQGIDNELYSSENLEDLWKDFDSPDENKKTQQKQTVYLKQLKNQAYFNLIDAEAVTKKFAGLDQERINLSAFNQSQINDLNYLTTIYQQSFLNIINDGGPRTQRVTLSYYLPGEEYSLDGVLLQTSTLPQFSAYDLGALNYNQAFGPDENGQYPLTRTSNNEGGIENQLGEGFAAAKNMAGQAIDFVGEKAVRAGLNYATAGAFETLPEPVKQMIEQMAWGTIKKNLEPILKILIALMAGALASLLALISKVISFFSVGGGAKEASTVIAKNAIWPQIKESFKSVLPQSKTAVVAENQLAERAVGTEAQSATHIQARPVSPTAGSAIAQIGQGAMATATQAVITTFGLAAGGMMIYQTVLNSAFLTQFPTGGSGGGGGAVYCNDVLVGNLTYYSQKDYRNIHICGSPGCQFGNVACGPTSVAMILNEDVVAMSVREGYLYCGKTTCGGSSFSRLIETLNSNGVPTSVVPLEQGSPTHVTDQISQYLAGGNVLLAGTDTHGIGHFYIIVCVESPGTVTAYDPWWGQNVVHKVGSDTFIMNIALVKN